MGCWEFRDPVKERLQDYERKCKVKKEKLFLSMKEKCPEVWQKMCNDLRQENIFFHEHVSFLCGATKWLRSENLDLLNSLNLTNWIIEHDVIDKKIKELNNLKKENETIEDLKIKEILNFIDAKLGVKDDSN